MKKMHLPLGGLLSLTLLACYSPESFEAEYLDDESKVQNSSEIGKIYTVNGDNQVCNPSISQDTVNFPASMLWLNFQGDLDVKSADSEYTVSVSKVRQHDRLTISDTAKNVKWYLMRDLSKGECQFQDPEWSTHPDYIIALRGHDIEGGSGCDVLDYGVFAVRLSDKKKFSFYDKGIIEVATPHLWIDPSAELKKDGDASTVKGFFGTNEVRLTYVDGDADVTKKGTQHIVFVDYSNGGKGKSIKLKKPANRSDWGIDSPLISPDGKFVVYQMDENNATWETYIQELSKDAEAIKVPRTKDMMSEPAQPHWFKFGNRLFVLWAEFPQGSPIFNEKHLTEKSVQDGSAGRTVMREIRLMAGVPRDLAVEWVGENIEIAPIPMIGGRSPDSKFISTGYEYAYLLQLP